MKKLLMTLGLLCFVVSISSCSADDLDEGVNTMEVLNSQTSPVLENGDKDKDKDFDDPKP